MAFHALAMEYGLEGWSCREFKHTSLIISHTQIQINHSFFDIQPSRAGKKRRNMPGVVVNGVPPDMKAPHVVGPTTKTATRPTNPLPQYLNDEAKQTQREPFDPQRHLNFQPPARVITMREIGLEGHGISPNAVSEPFPLFTQEAVQQMRAEIFSDEVLRDCQFASTFNKNMIRGMGPA